MKNKKRLICSICAVFMIAFSLLLLPYSKLKKSSAESIPSSSYVSQVVTVPLIGFTNDPYSQIKFFSSIFRFYTANTDSFTFSFVANGLDVEGNEYFDYLGPSNIRKQLYDDTTISGGYNFPAVSYNDSGNIVRWRFDFSKSGSPNTIAQNYFLRTLYLQSPNTSQVFNSDVISIEYGGVARTSLYPNGVIGGDFNYGFPASLIVNGNTNFLSNDSYNWIRFNDSLGNSFILFISYYCTEDMALLPTCYKHETVYYNELTNNQIYDEGYNAGYGIGSTEGYDTGYNTGYNQGFSNGETTGFGNGYNQGLETASETTFLGLIGATIDAPIKAFRGLFNFELLGVNMVSLITGLFTLCVIVCIVKLVLGGK